MLRTPCCNAKILLASFPAYYVGDKMSTTSCLPVTSAAISSYHQHLKSSYNRDIIRQDKWPPTPSRGYVSLAVVEGDDRCRDEYIGHTLQGDVKELMKNRKKISVHQILEVEGQSTPGLVLIEGAPGIGKSTLAWELCRKWEEFSCMQQYSLVVLLRLREEEVRKVRNVDQIFISYESDDKDTLVKEVLKVQGKGVLFILDGFDELPKALQEKGFLLNLIKGLVLPASTVLVTSRPSATAELLTSCRPQKRVEILGFTRESVEAYARSIFSSDPTKLEKFLAYISISNNPAINSLMYVPLNAAIIVQIYQHSFYRSSSATLPHSLTELYTQLCLTVLRRYVKTDDITTADKLQDLPMPLHKQLLQLCIIAFEGIKNEEVIFRRVPHDLVQFGFLDSVSALYGTGRVSYNFLHLTIQEFLAAYHIFQLRGDGLEVFEQYGGEKRWNVVWRFVAGLTKFEHFQGHIMKHKTYGEAMQEDEIIVTDHFIQCLFEAQTFTYFLSPPTPKVCKCKLHDATPLDSYALGYCVSRIPTAMAWEVQCSHSPAEYFTKPFIKNTPSANVGNKINFFECRALQLCDFKHLPLQEIRHLKLVDCDLTNTDLIHLSELIPNMPSLEVFVLNYQFTPEGDGFLKVLQQLSHSNVTTLDICDTGFCSLLQSDSRCDYISALKSLIDPSSGRLQELTAGDYYDDDGTLARLLSPPSSLRTLHLWKPNLLSSHFEDNTCLTTLCIDVWKWSNVQLSSVVKIVKHNKTLLYMKLRHVASGNSELRKRDSVLGAIADALQENTILQEFEVTYDNDLIQHIAFTLDKRLVWTALADIIALETL